MTILRQLPLFRPAGEKFYADIWLLARQRLHAAGVKSVSADSRCTFSEQDDFSPIVGMASPAVWQL
ncbi:laccase domain-containing protein [Pantoea ananatis]